AGFDDGTVLIWDSETRERLAAIERPQSVAHAIAFSPEGQRIMVGGESIDSGDRQYRRSGEVRVYELTTRRLLAESRGYGGAVFSVQFSPNGRRLVAGS